MTVRLIKVGDVKLDMITLESHGRAKVTFTQPVTNGYCYHARYIEGPFEGEPCSHEAVPSVTVWIEE